MAITFRKTLFLASIAAVALVLSACKGFYGTKTSGQTTEEQQATEQEEVTPSDGGITITATDAGFEPSPATVKSGETITWVNDSSKTLQIGSANHPTHTINQEITGDAFVIKLAPGESKTIAVTKVGSWGYHNHLGPSITGTVIVE